MILGVTRNEELFEGIGESFLQLITLHQVAWRNWEKVGILLLGTSILIIIVDLLSNIIRKKFK
ncbi:MAG: hypothetical protein ACTHW2_02140 [Tissierella sp.]|uniref:hypothetical protein n=1 Tax=Tissierella sp. TaxID=41274 RepID=UPI003F957C83